jgi:hypothetical protein
MPANHAGHELEGDDWELATVVVPLVADPADVSDPAAVLRDLWADGGLAEAVVDAWEPAELLASLLLPATALAAPAGAAFAPLAVSEDRELPATHETDAPSSKVQVLPVTRMFAAA